MRYPCLAFAVLLGVVSSGCSKGEKVPARSVQEVKSIKIEAVKTQAIRRNVDVVGTLAADDQVTISAEASGRVSRILADLGDRVTPGQVLVELDREKLQVQRRRAEGRARAGAGEIRRRQPGPPAADRADARRPEGRGGTAAGEAVARSGGRALQASAGAPSSSSTMPTRPIDPNKRATIRRSRTPRTCAPTSPHPSPRPSSPIASCATRPFARRSTATSRSASSRSVSS